MIEALYWKTKSPQKPTKYLYMIMSFKKVSTCVAKNTMLWAAAELLGWAGQYIENQGDMTGSSPRGKLEATETEASQWCDDQKTSSVY